MKFLMILILSPIAFLFSIFFLGFFNTVGGVFGSALVLGYLHDKKVTKNRFGK